MSFRVKYNIDFLLSCDVQIMSFRVKYNVDLLLVRHADHVLSREVQWPIGNASRMVGVGVRRVWGDVCVF